MGWSQSAITGISGELWFEWERNYSKTDICNVRPDWRYYFHLDSPTIQRCDVDRHGLSPSPYFKSNGRLKKMNLTRIDRTPQIFVSREELPTWLATKGRGVTS